MMMLILTFLQIRSDRELRSQLISVVAVGLKRGGADFNVQVGDGFQFSHLHDSVQLVPTLPLTLGLTPGLALGFTSTRFV